MSFMKVPFQSLFKKVVLIRKFENKLLELFSKGDLFGTTHTYVGQEAIAASVMSLLTDDDVVFSNHRGHGHYLAKNDDPLGLMAEIMGREIGVCGGRGGSQHLCDKGFYSNGIQGGYLSNALGMAFSEKYLGTNNIVVAFIGDGTLGEGAVYETLNLASLLKVPLLIIVENNLYAQTTPIEMNLAGTILGRAKAFDIQAGEIESNDVAVLYPIFHDVINKVRKEQKAYVQVVRTYRLNAHSKGDDFRDQSEIERWRLKDPITYFTTKMTKDEREKVNLEVDERLASVEKQVRASDFASLNLGDK
jgi:TPP-dependent pyruvate/acetoin dehydrogenase alpha subunit